MQILSRKSGVVNFKSAFFFHIPIISLACSQNCKLNLEIHSIEGMYYIICNSLHATLELARELKQASLKTE